MGEVYKARDVRLERFVAIKVLPSEVASDPERLRRFEREARAASALNHPNILTVHDVGTENSVSFIAMEFIEGRTLRELLTEGPLPTRNLLEIAVQIAEGLASAHEAGIVHRDLKPANVMVSRDGFVKILDFGLAKSRAIPVDAGSDTAAPTETASTEPGRLLGTVSYMSPEQALGKHVDFRSDQFAFGSVLYEMATGRLAFRRTSSIDTLAAIIHEDPEPAGDLAQKVPLPLLWIIERCLAKDPEGRFASTEDLARDLSGLQQHLAEMSGSTRPSLSARSRSRVFRRHPVAAGLVGGLLAVGLIGGSLLILRQRKGAGAVTLSMLPPAGSRFNTNTTAPAPPALSPDGRRIVFGATDESGRSRLWIRSFEESNARPLAGTEGAIYPFWSPDSRFIAFFAEGRLRKMDASGGVVEPLCEARNGRGGTWNQRGEILFAPDRNGPLMVLPAGGGSPRAVTRDEGQVSDFSHRWPVFLPDGRHFLFLRRNPGREEDGIYVGSLDSPNRKRLLADVSNVAYSPPGYLVFVRSGSLVAAPFDSDALAVGGDVRLLDERVSYQSYRWYGAFTVSQNGRLAYEAAPAAGAAILTWFDRGGRALGPVGPPADYGGIRLSPDERRCAVEVRDPATGMVGIWVIELSRGISTRLSSADSMNVSPTWSPDGNTIVYTSSRKGGPWNLVSRDSAAANPETLLSDSRSNQAPTDWSPDGKRIAFNNTNPDPSEKYQVWLFDVAEKRPSPYLRSAFNEREAVFSRDGQFLAYVSDESGREEVYVRPVQSASRKWQISRDGGGQPSWRRDGQELWYLSTPNRVFAVSVQLGAEPQFGAPALLFEAPLPLSPSDIGLYAGTKDGQKFLIVTAREGVTPLDVQLNWTERLAAR
jgi:serine/threonine protein kinase/Tol biopolymer transport system component